MALDAKSARMAGLAAAANMSPEQRLARSRAGSTAAAAAHKRRKELRDAEAAKKRKKLLKKGYTPQEVETKLYDLGLIPKHRQTPKWDAPIPSDDELEGYYDIIDEKFPGLTQGQRKRQAAQMLRADISRYEWKAR